MIEDDTLLIIAFCIMGALWLCNLYGVNLTGGAWLGRLTP